MSELPPSVSGFVCHCPELRLYWYKVSQGSVEITAEHKFTEDELEDLIADFLAHDNEERAEFMAKLTGLARLSPHKLIFFDLSKEEIKVVEPADHWKEHDRKRDESEKG